MMKAVLMAGGKGTRIASVANTIPKPMIPVDGVPVLEREIDCLRSQGIVDLILTVGHLSDVIIDYFGDGSKQSPVTGQPFGVNIKYYVEKEPLGNAGALFEIKDELTDDFLLLNADAVFDVDFHRLIAFHQKHKGLATLFTHPNSHPYDSSLIIADENHAVVEWLNKEDPRPEFYKNRVNAGIHVLSPAALDIPRPEGKVDLDRHILKPLAGTGKLFAYDSPEYVKDMGTPDRFASVCEDYRNGRVQARNLHNKQKAIFLDRDGTINKYVGFLRDIGSFELIDGVSEAIKRINNSDYLAIVATNQPVIARGEVTYEQLKQIHNKMETLLGQEGAFLDDIFFCPHHPDKGFPGEIPELKIRCHCRKPEPGLLLEAAEKYNIDLANSWMIGDGEADIKAGTNAGCRTVLIGSGDRLFGQTFTAGSLPDAVEMILNTKGSR